MNKRLWGRLQRLRGRWWEGCVSEGVEGTHPQCVQLSLWTECVRRVVCAWERVLNEGGSKLTEGVISFETELGRVGMPCDIWSLGPWVCSQEGKKKTAHTGGNCRCYKTFSSLSLPNPRNMVWTLVLVNLYQRLYRCGWVNNWVKWSN